MTLRAQPTGSAFRGDRRIRYWYVTEAVELPAALAPTFIKRYGPFR